MKPETRVKALATCYIKARKNNSDGLNHLAMDIANRLNELAEEDPAAAIKLKEKLQEMGYYK